MFGKSQISPHNPEVGGSNPSPATIKKTAYKAIYRRFFVWTLLTDCIFAMYLAIFSYKTVSFCQPLYLILGNRKMSRIIFWMPSPKNC